MKTDDTYWNMWDAEIPKKPPYSYPNKVIDINTCWWIIEGDPHCEENNPQDIWFDKISYRFIEYQDITNSKIIQDGRFIKCIQFNTDTLYEFYEKKIANPEVTAYFQSASTLEKKYIRFGKFIDWNMLDITYDRYLAMSQELVRWCIQNEVSYRFQKMPPPSNYIFKDDSYKSIKWVIPD